MKKLHQETITVHQNYQGDEQNSIVHPIYATTAYRFDDAKHAANLFNLEQAGNIYSRITNPSSNHFANAINCLDGGVGALATSTGSAALTLVILALAQQNDEILVSSSMYGGTLSLLRNTLPLYGIKSIFFDQNDSIFEIEQLITNKTKLILAETINNPLVDVLDFKKISNITKKHKLPLVIDNTFATAYLFKPFDYGANVVVYSATKYLGGHGNALGGVIVDGGNFDWNSSIKYPQLTTPNQAYHNLIFSEHFKDAALISYIRTILLRDIGPSLSSFDAFLLSNGLATLALRLDRISSNALELAHYLEKHPKVESVAYPLLKSHKSYQLAKTYFTKGASGILSFKIKGKKEAGIRLINNTQLIIHATNVGDVRTIITHPASTTHRQLSENELSQINITPNLIRISVGIENIADIISDLEYALSFV